MGGRVCGVCLLLCALLGGFLPEVRAVGLNNLIWGKQHAKAATMSPNGCRYSPLRSKSDATKMCQFLVASGVGSCFDALNRPSEQLDELRSQFGVQKCEHECFSVAKKMDSMGLYHVNGYVFVDNKGAQGENETCEGVAAAIQVDEGRECGVRGIQDYGLICEALVKSEAKNCSDLLTSDSSTKTAVRKALGLQACHKECLYVSNTMHLLNHYDYHRERFLMQDDSPDKIVPACSKIGATAYVMYRTNAGATGGVSFTSMT